MVGTHVARYRIDSLLGEGGMGKVYKAFDESLGRALAIKILPPDVTRDADRLERFIREARSASSLNHPNVVTIYEVGEADDATHFIAMELVEGETLRERLMRGKLELRRALEVLAQVADGVAAAHAAGVVHRDLKPENVIIAKNGFAKILDFGLAKLREAGPSDESETAKKTSPGTVLGTIGYMSPEQARAENVDHRTDIFSLGCILYECVTGVRPFRGESSVDTMHKIIYSDPKPLAEAAPDVPHELQRLIRKCLAKDRDERYQSAKDLALDLRDLRRELDSQPSAAAAVGGASGRRRVPVWWFAAIAAVVVPAVIVLMVIRSRSEKAAPKPVAPAQPMSMTRLTNSGMVIGAAISPNGEYLAYAYSDAGLHSILLRQIATGSAIELVPPARMGVWGLSFSRDSRSLYYSIKSGDDPGGGLYTIPILGGQARRLLLRIDGHVEFSPDATRMIFLRYHEPQPGHTAIVMANADGSDERIVTSKQPPQSLGVFWGAPAWSPDGKTIVFSLRGAKRWKLMQIDVATKRESEFSPQEWLELGDVRWMPDGSGVVAIGAVQGQRPQVWLVGRDGGRRAITNDLNGYRLVSVSADGQQLVTVAADASSSIWRVPLSSSGRPSKLSTGRYDGLRGIASTTDGRVLFSSNDSGRWEIWSLDPKSGERRQVTSAPFPSIGVGVSPDGRHLVTGMPRQNDWALARMNADGSGVTFLCPIAPTRDGYLTYSFTPDGKWIVFDSATDGVWRIYKIGVEGGSPARVIEQGDSPAVSPDGKLVAYIRGGRLEVAPIEGGDPLRRFEKVTVTNSSSVRWSRDGKGLLHNAGLEDRINVWYQPLDGSPGRQVTRFDDEYIHKFDPTPDGKELIVSRGVLSRDAVLIRNFR